MPFGVQVLVLDEENFPALSAASSPAKPLSKRAAAAAATGRPASPDTPLMDRADEASTPDASRSTSPAPAAAAQRAAAAATEPAEESGAVANAAAATAADAQAAAADADSAPASKAAEAAAASTEPGAEEAAPGAAASCAAAAAEDGEAGAAGEGTEEEEQSGSAAPGPAQLSAPPTPAWGRKDRPAFLQAGSADTEAAHGATAAATKPELAGAPKRAVPITQVTTFLRIHSQLVGIRLQGDASRACRVSTPGCTRSSQPQRPLTALPCVSAEHVSGAQGRPQSRRRQRPLGGDGGGCGRPVL